MNNCGIYRLEDLKGRLYIGSTTNFEKRRKEHFRALMNGNHQNKKLRDYFAKYGIKGLRFHIVEYCSEIELLAREQFYIDRLKPFFNVNPFANKPPSWSGKSHKPETLEKMRVWNTGRKHTPETLDKMRVYRNSPEGREQMRKNSLKGSGSRWTGKRHSEETKKKIGVAHKGRIVSESTRLKLSRAHKGKVISPETIEKMKASHAKRLQQK